ncbi:MAG: methyltransferase domain-containing protein [Deltaproteobacteria bacterium]|nr:methyltransferase domain-containing protein [Deltaproteobacteria bacterium]
MSDIDNWIEILQCPDCHNKIRFAEGLKRPVVCTNCGRRFEQLQGIWRFLPSRIFDQEFKDAEKQGWEKKNQQGIAAGWDPPPEHYLNLPHYPHPYYQAAEWYLNIVLKYCGPWEGKKVLELGAAECWATRTFAEAGSDAVALDYDPNRMLKAQVIMDRLPIHFFRLTGDAECLPFNDNSLDTVFCCSVLHHFFDLEKAVREIARTLKPGGKFIGIHEAYHPPYYSKERILRMSKDTIPNIEAGINESSYTAGHYRRLFSRAGLRFELLNPVWDTEWKGSSLVVSPGIAVCGNPEYVPRMFIARSGRRSLIGLISRFILRSGIWRIAATRAVFSRIRFMILNWTTKEKILIAEKPFR